MKSWYLGNCFNTFLKTVVKFLWHFSPRVAKFQWCFTPHVASFLPQFIVAYNLWRFSPHVVVAYLRYQGACYAYERVGQMQNLFPYL